MLTSRNSSNSNRKQLLTKINRLLKAGRKTCLNVQIDKKRYHGQQMKNVTLSEDTLYFCYGEKEYTFNLDEIIMTRRMRTKKYLLIFEPNRKLGKDPKKDREKTQEKNEDKAAEQAKKQEDKDAEQKKKDDKKAQEEKSEMQKRDNKVRDKKKEDKKKKNDKKKKSNK